MADRFVHFCGIAGRTSEVPLKCRLPLLPYSIHLKQPVLQPTLLLYKLMSVLRMHDGSINKRRKMLGTRRIFQIGSSKGLPPEVL